MGKSSRQNVQIGLILGMCHGYVLLSLSLTSQPADSLPVLCSAVKSSLIIEASGDRSGRL